MCADHYLPDEYPDEPRLRDLPRTPLHWPRIVLLALIRLYQMTLSKGLPEMLFWQHLFFEVATLAFQHCAGCFRSTRSRRPLS